MIDADNRTASFYDHTAPEYDLQMAGTGVMALRDTFRGRVAAATHPQGTILDLGCGTGIDADAYSALGYRVIAYDISPGMVERLRARCATAVAAHAITPLAGTLEVLVRHLRSAHPVQTVAANFAVLNHFPDPGDVLRRLAPYLAPGGAVVGSVLNPFFRQDIMRGWWWAAALRTGGRGAITVNGAVTTHRFLPGTLRRAAAPEFELVELLGFENDGGASVLRPVRGRSLLRPQFWLAEWRKSC